MSPLTENTINLEAEEKGLPEYSAGDSSDGEAGEIVADKAGDAPRNIHGLRVSILHIRVFLAVISNHSPL